MHMTREQNCYVTRVNKVIDYINENYSYELNLEQLSQVAGLSKFHFHRIFSSIVGYSLASFIQRIRVEKAAAQLIYSKNKPITQIAFDCGYNSSQFFSRQFKNQFGMSPRKWRSDKQHYKSRSSALRKEHKPENENRRFAVTPSIAVFSGTHFYYYRSICDYTGDIDFFTVSFGRVFSWLSSCSEEAIQKATVMAMHIDIPGITPDSFKQISIGVGLSEECACREDIGHTYIQSVKAAVFNYILNEDEFERAWDYIYGEWLPGSGYSLGDSASMEIYHNDPSAHPEKKYKVSFYLPLSNT